MGTWKTPALTKQEPAEVRCIFRTEVPIVIREVDVEAWQRYVEETLPSSYQVDEQPDRWGNHPVRLINMTYEAASANSSDITRRLRLSGMHHTPLPGKRVKLCDCPKGTTRCAQRMTND